MHSTHTHTNTKWCAVSGLASIQYAVGILHVVQLHLANHSVACNILIKLFPLNNNDNNNSTYILHVYVYSPLSDSVRGYALNFLSK